jgi:fumarylacetoacetase
MTGPVIDRTHDPERTSWLPAAQGHPDFPIQNLPYGIFSPPGQHPRAGVAIGDQILDLRALAGHLGSAGALVSGNTLNDLMAAPREERATLRRQLSDLLSDQGHRALVEPMLCEAASATMHLPAVIGDYTDFYAGIHHAINIGKQFRPDNPLLPNYKYVPIGYHGRASSIRPSSVPVVRPWGQRKAPGSDVPIFAPSVRLDYELELGAWIGRGNALGEPIAVAEAGEHVAGLCLLNDWSARDFQAWEYQPLGPFLAKSFQTTVSPWVITSEALAPFRIAQPARPGGDPPPLPYLWDDADQSSGAYAITLQVSIATARMREDGIAPHVLSRGPASNMYWTIAQLVAHHSSNGCNLRAGDLFGTGTISAPSDDGFGSLMEISRGGTAPVTLPNGEVRSFLEDGDEIILSGTASSAGFVSIGFGPCRAVILPADDSR